MKRLLHLGLALSLALVLACGGKEDSISKDCPRDLPDACPTPTPSYANEVSAIFTTHCTSCHSPGGENSSLPLDTYEQIFSNRRDVLDQVYSCLMPNTGGVPLSSDERAALLAWLVCGSPNN
jgi:uncharacterized membrane protein